MSRWMLVLLVACTKPPVVVKPSVTPPPPPVTETPKPTPPAHYPELPHIVLGGDAPATQFVLIDPVVKSGGCGMDSLDVVFEIRNPDPTVRVQIKSPPNMFFSTGSLVDGKPVEEDGCKPVPDLGRSLKTDAVGERVVSVSTTQGGAHVPFYILVTHDEFLDPLAERRDAKTDGVASRDLFALYPLLEQRHVDDADVRARLLRTVPRELFVYAARDLDDARHSPLLRRKDRDFIDRPLVRPRANEPLLYVAGQVITLDGDLFRYVTPDQLTTTPPATIAFPERVRNPHRAELGEVPAELRAPLAAYDRALATRADCIRALHKDIDARNKTSASMPAGPKREAFDAETRKLAIKVSGEEKPKCSAEVDRMDDALEKLLGFTTDRERQRILVETRRRLGGPP